MAAVSIAQLICKSYTDIDVEAEAFIAEYDAEKGIWKVRIKSKQDFDSTHRAWLDREHAVYIEADDATILKVSVNTNSIKEYYKLKSSYER